MIPLCARLCHSVLRSSWHLLSSQRGLRLSLAACRFTAIDAVASAHLTPEFRAADVGTLHSLCSQRARPRADSELPRRARWSLGGGVSVWGGREAAHPHTHSARCLPFTECRAFAESKTSSVDLLYARMDRMSASYAYQNLLQLLEQNQVCVLPSISVLLSVTTDKNFFKILLVRCNFLDKIVCVTGKAAR